MSTLKTRVLSLLVVFGFFTSPVRSETSGLLPEPKSSTGVNQQRQYMASYSNMGQYQSPASSRDTFADAATDLGYNVPSSGGYSQTQMTSGQPMMYHYQVHPMGNSQPSSSYGSSYGPDEDDDEMGGKGGGGGGQIGLLGLLGLKGLKGVKFFKAAKAIAVLGPIIGPIFAPLLGLAAPLLLLALPLLLLGPILPIVLPLLLLLGILFLPIPVITIPGRSASASFVQAARGALESAMTEDCAERITCEISRAAKLYGFDPPWVTNFIEKSSSKYKWMDQISRAYKASECQNYKCSIVNRFKKVLKNN